MLFWYILQTEGDALRLKNEGKVVEGLSLGEESREENA